MLKFMQYTDSPFFKDESPIWINPDKIIDAVYMDDLETPRFHIRYDERFNEVLVSPESNTESLLAIGLTH